VTSVEGIGHLLSDRLLAIPDYQRAYSWELDEVGELWSDLADSIRADSSEYFLGSVVTTKSKDQPRHQVIDGQQRLATVSLMYAVMRDIFAQHSDERANDIEHDLLGKPNMITRAREPRLVLNAEDNEVFRQLTLERHASRAVVAKQDSHQRLTNAFKFFEDQFTNLIANLDAKSWQRPL